MPRRETLLIPFLKDGIRERKYDNLKSLDLQTFSLKLERKINGSVDRSGQLILRDWSKIKSRPYIFDDSYSDAKSGFQSALNKSEFLERLKQKETNGFRVYKFLTDSETRKKKTENRKKKTMQATPNSSSSVAGSPESGYASGHEDLEAAPEMDIEPEQFLSNVVHHDHPYITNTENALVVENIQHSNILDPSSETEVLFPYSAVEDDIAIFGPLNLGSEEEVFSQPLHSPGNQMDIISQPNQEDVTSQNMHLSNQAIVYQPMNLDAEIEINSQTIHLGNQADYLFQTQDHKNASVALQSVHLENQAQGIQALFRSNIQTDYEDFQPMLIEDRTGSPLQSNANIYFVNSQPLGNQEIISQPVNPSNQTEVILKPIYPGNQAKFNSQPVCPPNQEENDSVDSVMELSPLIDTLIPGFADKSMDEIYSMFLDWDDNSMGDTMLATSVKLIHESAETNTVIKRVGETLADAADWN